jgi:hypothetical protein
MLLAPSGLLSHGSAEDVSKPTADDEETSIKELCPD